MLEQSKLRRLRRTDLLALAVSQDEEITMLRARLFAAETALANRQINLQRSGSIAEAALALNGVFEAAQSAAQQYLDTIQQRSQEQDVLYQQKLQEAQAKANQIIFDAERYRRYWMEASAKMSCFYNGHQPSQTR